MSENPGGDGVSLIGREGFERIVAGFLTGRVAGDDILGPMYPAEDMEGARERLRRFLVYRFGGRRII